ncbi:MAG: hypothetical protein WA012_13745 [Rhodoferax sp.]|jgi:hypothetical protein|uniref:hypothetical protein n=1 Tax=Rhodoferax sp. TaxID=50421 RepID=UPI003BB10D8F|nr:hypothetical protein [Rhodoferax sp.]
MKKTKVEDIEMRAEYTRDDLGPLVRGKYAARYAKATNIVVIDPSLAKVFPNSASVNEALRGLLNIATAATAINHRTGRPSSKRTTASQA